MIKNPTWWTSGIWTFVPCRGVSRTLIWFGILIDIYIFFSGLMMALQPLSQYVYIYCSPSVRICRVALILVQPVDFSLQILGFVDHFARFDTLSMPSPFALDPIRAQLCVWCLFRNNINCKLHGGNIYLSL